MSTVNKIFVLCVIIIQVTLSQQAENYFPNNTGFMWFYKTTPLDSSGNTIDSLSVNRTNLYIVDETFRGKFSRFVVSEIDTNYIHFESTNGWQYIKSFGNFDSLPFVDTLGIIRFLASFEGWHSYYRFASSIATTYTIVSRDTTIAINGTSYPLRFKITGKRFNDQMISVPSGSFYCKKFAINYSANLVTHIPPLPPFEIPIIQIPDTVWITNSLWIVKEHTPPVKIDLSLLNLGSFRIPGQLTELIDYKTTSVKYTTENPTELLLEQNYPNPFNSSTIIRYRIPQETKISLLIYDITGKEVCILSDETHKQGNYEIIYNASGLSSGIYYLVLRSEKFVEAHKFVLLR
ncbi:MAG: T9SS type A sorting domain-containing protein [Bacteroidota bacterium]|nr:T9SS type A sorting domain-containing protein [Bacteroidota bacterium]